MSEKTEQVEVTFEMAIFIAECMNEVSPKDAATREWYAIADRLAVSDV